MPPMIGYFLFFLAFLFSSAYLFYKTEYAAYLYTFVAVSAVARLGERERNDFVKSNFPNNLYYQIRMLENAILAFPFLMVLLYYHHWLMAGLLMLYAISSLFLQFGKKFHITIPTPFSKRPFEFSLGFRNAYVFYAIAYFITYQSIAVGNANLGIFSLALTFLISFSHYLNTEEAFFVWVYAATPKQFLGKKIATAIRHSSILSLPIGIAIALYFPENISILVGVQCLGYLFLSVMVLAKYSSFPGKMNLPQGILLGLSLWFPPLLIMVIPVFYTQSIKRLNQILV